MSDGLGAESALCTSCGLCCTGALHDRAKLDEDELAAAAAVGLTVRDTPELCFELPCPKLDGATCTIYGSRPRVCAAYACRLLDEVRKGRDLESALPVVAEAHRLARAVQAVLPSGATLPEMRGLLAAGTSPTPLQLHLYAFTAYLDRHFRNGSEGPLLKSESCS